ncbi:argininosuccinate lyase C-terminal-domain-containing protein [Xylaria scruposa]|nr:argininosuccinate lyase C-terminal-domain-containing protein [Xylaria scruposa]
MLDHVKTIYDSLQIANGILATLTVKPERMRAALDPFMLATDLADYLVRKGVPFRETHHLVWGGVSHTFDYERSVEMRSVKGGTSRARVLEQVKVLKAVLA